MNNDALNNDEAKKELDEIKAIEKNIDRERLFTKQLNIHIVLKLFKQ